MPGLKLLDLGFYYALAEYAREKNESGFVSKSAIKIVAAEHDFYSAKVALERLVAHGLAVPVEGGWQLDWEGQSTKELRDDKRAKNALDQRNKRARDADRKVRHEQDDHTKCAKPYCAKATRWARGKKPLSEPDVSPDALEVKKVRTLSSIEGFAVTVPYPKDAAGASLSGRHFDSAQQEPTSAQPDSAQDDSAFYIEIED
ncbi:hypothetical protein ACMHYT_30300 [Rhodococcus qingshengii]|uniref:hypothetical protein n=1 Tax=Rhodococcus qingshengii TaxID=334542 RepID=UPI0039C340CE